PCQILINRVSQILPLDCPTTTAFDNGCGTGVLTTVLKQHYPHIPILASDCADGMVDILKSKIQLQNWTGVQTQVADSRNLTSVHTDSFSHAFSSFMVCLAPDPDKIVAEMHRVLKPDGVLGLAVWGKPDFGPFTSPWEKACRQVMPDYQQPIQMGAKWTLATNVREGLVKAGFRDVVVWEEECEW
ncbi:S-adenosyl-L-methionine-dependent methyltransferase, partial [Usnea florida]